MPTSIIYAICLGTPLFYATMSCMVVKQENYLQFLTDVSDKDLF